MFGKAYLNIPVVRRKMDFRSVIPSKPGPSRAAYRLHSEDQEAVKHFIALESVRYGTLILDTAKGGIDWTDLIAEGMTRDLGYANVLGLGKYFLDEIVKRVNVIAPDVILELPYKHANERR